MFARHTHPRMKVSSVARWKSFIDKLHPQLPLTTKESQRLLTALTSSFRKHLDEAHPTSSAEDEQKARPAAVGVPKPQTRTWHSSATYADKHLASVLTNPLLVKGGKRLDYTSAKVALAKDPSKDPIELLEEYQQQGAATVPIATLCLQTLLDKLKVLTPEEKLARVQEIEPGRRTFLWLLENGFHNTSHTADSLELQDLLVYFLTKEGREQNIWQWLQMDTRVPESAGRDRQSFSHRKNEIHAYRWRGRLLYALMVAKLGLEADERAVAAPITKVNDALETFFKACEIKASAPNLDQIHFPLVAPYTRLARELRRGGYKAKHGLDADKLERLITYLPLILNIELPLILELEIARLRLIHPHKPSAQETYDLLQEVFLFRDDQPDDAHKISTLVIDPKTPSQANNWSVYLARTIVVLRAQGQHEQASWVESIVRLRCPQIGKYLVGHVNRLSRMDQTVARSEEPEQDKFRVPFPTFV